jgi:hypothetical protein
LRELCAVLEAAFGRRSYLAQARNGQTFVVVNGEESSGVQSVQTGPVWSSTGQ